MRFVPDFTHSRYTKKSYVINRVFNYRSKVPRGVTLRFSIRFINAAVVPKRALQQIVPTRKNWTRNKTSNVPAKRLTAIMYVVTR